MDITNIMNMENAVRNKSLAGALKDKDGSSDFKNILKKAVAQSEDVRRSANMSGNRVKDKKLMDVCVQMESIFVSKMLKTMRNTVPKSKMFHGGFAEEIFEDMLYDEYATSLSKNENLGIASMLYDDLSGR